MARSKYAGVDHRAIAIATAIFALGSCGAPEAEVASEGQSSAEVDVTIGSELAMRKHLADGDEHRLSARKLIEHGRSLFVANWTRDEGQGRPLTNGEGEPLADPSSPLVFPRDGNRVSGPDTASCSHCHNTPDVGGGGDIAMGVYVLGERFDFPTFDREDHVIKRGTLDERGVPTTLQTIGNFRKVVGMAGAGYIEMLSRQMTADLRAQAAACGRDRTCVLASKGVAFGSITHQASGAWDTSRVIGLPAPSLISAGTAPPSLIIRPFSQAGASVSLRDFTNGAFNRHQGMQSEERFGRNADPDGDGVVNELTRADLTAISVYEATLPVPGRVIPSDRAAAAAVAQGEALFGSIGCTSCHMSALPLDNQGWIYSEPNPFNPDGNLRPGDGVAPVAVNLTRRNAAGPQLEAKHGVVMVPAYTDLRLHDITTGRPPCASNPQLIANDECDESAEALDQNAARGSAAFFAGNHKFITRKLWGIANQHTYGPQGQFTTMRDAILAHHGEATTSHNAFQSLAADQQAAVVEFLKSLQILPAGTACRVIDDHGKCLEADADDRDAREDRDDSPADDDLTDALFGLPNVAVSAFLPRHAHAIGDESSGVTHVADGQEFTMAPAALAEAGRQLFGTRFDASEGTGHPSFNGADVPLHDPSSPLVGSHFINRISGPVSSSCTGCHNTPLVGGGGDIIGTVNVLGNRFDFVTFDQHDTIPLRGALDERGIPATLQSVSDARRSVGMSGSGYIEMLSRQMTIELQAQARACASGSTCPLSAKGVAFGKLTHRADGTWDTSQVSGIVALSLTTTGTTPPSLVIRPFFSTGIVNSIRVFSLNSFSRLHGVEAEERFGVGQDPDGDGVVNELTRADATAVAVFEATMAPPGRIIPRDKAVRKAIARGEQLFGTVGCATCHLASLPLDNQGWMYSEPNPFNPPGNLRISDGVPSLFVDLTDPTLPGPRLKPRNGVINVPAYTDLKVHQMTTGMPSCAMNPQLIATHECDGNVEPLDQAHSVTGDDGSIAPEFFAGNGMFITRKLWGIANQEARFNHQGSYTTMREAVTHGHFGEALHSKLAFDALGASDQNAIVEFLKSLQVLPDGTPCSIVDDRGECVAEDWARHL